MCFFRMRLWLWISKGVIVAPMIEVPKSADRVIRFGGYVFDSDSNELFRGSQRIEMQPQPARLLALFLSKPRSILSQEEITAHIWPNSVVEYEQRIRQSIIKSERGIKNDQAAIRTAENIFNNTTKSAVKVVQSTIVAQKTKAVASKKNNIAVMKQSFGLIGNLRGLVSAVRQKTKIRYRIYAESNASILLLVDSEYGAGGPALAP